MLKSLRIFSLVLVLSSASLAANSKIDEVLKQLETVRTFSGVSISPDGHWITWTQTSEVQSGTEIYLLDRAQTAAKPVRVTAGTELSAYREGGVAWSPNSREFAFLSNAAGEQEQIFVAEAASAKVHRLTSLKGYITDVRWSPSGKQLAVLFAENGGGGGPLEAVPAQTGVIGGEVHNQRLTLIDSTSGAAHPVSPPELNIYEYDWAPGGDQFAAIAAPGPADNNWWTAKLYALDIKSRAMKLLYAPPVERQIAVPRWSPDGKTIGFIGGLMSDEGFIGGDIFVLPGDGGAVRDLTPGTMASPSGLLWRTNDEILFSEAVDGGGALATLDVPSGRSEMLWKGGQTLHQDGNYPNLAIARDGKTSAAIRSDWSEPPEVWAGPLGTWQRLTKENAAQKPQWGQAESILWQSAGHSVQGWLVYPTNFDPAKKYPMVVEIHGGPAGVRSAGWPGTHFDMSVMAGLGYFVFFPNPRGSYGGGEEFTQANVKDFGGGDLRDILLGVDAVIKHAPVDPERLGVTGWSYGGFMTMWTVTQTQRFRAAVSGAGIANWLSYYGQNSIDEWMIPYFGATVYDDPAVYAKSSPITYIKQVKTPTLVVVGERDGECPAPQSFEFWHALKTLDVPSELVVYPGEGHSFHDAKDRLDVLRRTLDWFEKYLAP